MPKVLKRVAFVLLLAVMAGYAFVQLSGPQGISALVAKRDAIKRLEDENRNLEFGNQKLREYNDALMKNKPEVVLPLIRKKTNKVRPGEKDFRVEDEQPADSVK